MTGGGDVITGLWTWVLVLISPVLTIAAFWLVFGRDVTGAGTWSPAIGVRDIATSEAVAIPSATMQEPARAYGGAISSDREGKPRRSRPGRVRHSAR